MTGSRRLSVMKLESFALLYRRVCGRLQRAEQDFTPCCLVSRTSSVSACQYVVAVAVADE